MHSRSSSPVRSMGEVPRRGGGGNRRPNTLRYKRGTRSRHPTANMWLNIWISCMAYVAAKTLRRARDLRGKLTNAEALLWPQLRRGIRGLRFRRQHPIGPYIADFASIPVRLVIEIDGATHSTEKERLHDARRDAFLRARSWQIVRVTNEEVYRSLDAVLELIWQRSSGTS